MLPREIAITFCGMLQFNRQKLDINPDYTVPEFVDNNRPLLRALCKRLKKHCGLRFDNHRVTLSINAGICMFLVGEGMYDPAKIFVPSDDHIQY